MLMIFSIDLSSIVNEVIRRNNFIFFYKRFHTQKKMRNANKAFIQMILYALESIKKQLPLISNIKSKTEQVFAHIYISNLSQMLLKSIKNKQATSSQTLIKRKMLSFLFYVFSFLDVLSIQKCSSFFFFIIGHIKIQSFLFCLCIFFLDVFEYIGVLFFFVYVIGHIKMLSLLFAYVLFFLRCVLWLCIFFMKKIRNLLITSSVILLNFVLFCRNLKKTA